MLVKISWLECKILKTSLELFNDTCYLTFIPQIFNTNQFLNHIILPKLDAGIDLPTLKLELVPIRNYARNQGRMQGRVGD